MTSASMGTTSVRPARVVVVDLDRRVQQSIAEVLRVAGVEVVGTAGDVRSALKLIEDEQPTVLLMDPRLPDVRAGDALLSSVALAWPRMRVVLMGWADTTDRPAAANLSFVSKSAQPEDFVAAALAACNC